MSFLLLANPKSPEAIRWILVEAGYVVDADVKVAEMTLGVVGISKEERS